MLFYSLDRFLLILNCCSTSLPSLFVTLCLVPIGSCTLIGQLDQYALISTHYTNTTQLSFEPSPILGSSEKEIGRSSLKEV